eukprot:c27542_g1_i1 orf=285-494(-)
MRVWRVKTLSKPPQKEKEQSKLYAYTLNALTRTHNTTDARTHNAEVAHIHLFTTNRLNTHTRSQLEGYK